MDRTCFEKPGSFKKTLACCNLAAFKYHIHNESKMILTLLLPPLPPQKKREEEEECCNDSNKKSVAVNVIFSSVELACSLSDTVH